MMASKSKQLRTLVMVKSALYLIALLSINISLAQDAPKPKATLVQIDPYANYARTKLFGLEAKGNKFVYVFDRSGSMGELGGKPLREAKQELLASLKDLDDRQQFYIVFYNHEPRLFDAGTSKGRLVWATDDNKHDAAKFVDGIQADGGTDHIGALVLALRLRPDVIFLLTDGEQQDDLSNDDLKRVDRLNGGGAQINVIHFSPTPRPASTLVQLAHENRGQLISVDISKYGDAVKK